MLQILLSFLGTRLSGAGRSWLGHEMEAASAARLPEDLLRAYTGASRHAGRARLALTSAETARLHVIDAELTLGEWTVDDTVRAALLLATASADPSRFLQLAAACYEHGDTREQQSWLRALPLLPSPERFTAEAIDACRTNIVPLFQAIACENPYPSRLFPRGNFNQLVLKALFNAIDMSRITGLPRRLNDDLSRMASDYVLERQAASRPVPDDIWTVISATDAVRLRRVTPR